MLGSQQSPGKFSMSSVLPRDAAHFDEGLPRQAGKAQLGQPWGTGVFWKKEESKNTVMCRCGYVDLVFILWEAAGTGNPQPAPLAARPQTSPHCVSAVGRQRTEQQQGFIFSVLQKGN